MMHAYRLYFLASGEGAEHFDDIIAKDDEEAISTSEWSRSDEAMELWTSGRKVRIWPVRRQ
jgi:hypothetical protein